MKAPFLPLHVGEVVELHGLRRCPELNGRKGVVLSVVDNVHDDGGRVQVRLTGDDPKVVRVMPRHLQRGSIEVSFSDGDAVGVVGSERRRHVRTERPSPVSH